MAKIDRETRAFPFPYTTLPADGEACDFGMALRDYFATGALVGVLSRESIRVAGDSNKRIIADFVFDMADAMIEARKVEKYETTAEALAAIKERNDEKI